jgi:hypothetical protein
VAGNEAMPLKIEIAKLLDKQLDGFQPPPELQEEYDLLCAATVDVYHHHEL